MPPAFAVPPPSAPTPCLPVFPDSAENKTVCAAAELPDAVVLFTRKNVQVQPSAQAREHAGIRDGEKKILSLGFVVSFGTFVDSGSFVVCSEASSSVCYVSTLLVWFGRPSHITDGIG